jgi:hypothetical protein
MQGVAAPHKVLHSARQKCISEKNYSEKKIEVTQLWPMESVRMQIHDNAIPSKMHQKLSLSPAITHGIRCVTNKKNI